MSAETELKCPDCGGPVTVLYTRYEFDVPITTVWCDRTGESKAIIRNRER